MTEREWETADDPEPMLRFLSGKVTEAHLRLFAAACCRRIWPLLTDKRSRKCVTVAERYAQGKASGNALAAAAEEAEEVYQDSNLEANDPENPERQGAAIAEAAAQAAWLLGDPSPGFAGSVGDVVRCCAEAAGGGQLPFPAESAAQAALLREMVSYPSGSEG